MVFNANLWCSFSFRLSIVFIIGEKRNLITFVLVHSSANSHLHPLLWMSSLKKLYTLRNWGNSLLTVWYKMWTMCLQMWWTQLVNHLRFLLTTDNLSVKVTAKTVLLIFSVKDGTARYQHPPQFFTCYCCSEKLRTHKPWNKKL